MEKWGIQTQAINMFIETVKNKKSHTFKHFYVDF